MDPATLTEHVVRDLSRHRSRNDILMSICNASGMDWTEAQRFLHQVEQNQGEAIAARRRPLLVIMSLVAIVGGLLTAGGVVIATLDGWIVFLLQLPIPYLGNVVYFSLGVLAFVGGLVGLQSAMKRHTPS
jgi:hypothetical protein